MTGKLILVVAPSGSGKGVLLEALKEKHPEITFPLSCTTRSPRPGEVEGEKYYFISAEEFQTRAAQGDFIENASYGGNLYGVLKAPVLEALAAGKTLVRELEVQGARQIIANMPAQVLRTIFIDAGPWETLERRIRSRAPISEDELAARHARFEDERTFKTEAMRVVSNLDGEVEQAKKDFITAIEELTK